MSTITPNLTVRTQFYMDDENTVSGYDSVKKALSNLAKDQPDTANLFIVSNVIYGKARPVKMISFSVGKRRPVSGEVYRAGVTPLEAIKFLASQKGDKSVLSFGEASGTVLNQKNCEKIVWAIIQMHAAQHGSDYKDKEKALAEASSDLFKYLNLKSGGSRKFSSDALAEITAAKLTARNPTSPVTRSQVGGPEYWKERLETLRELQQQMHAELVKSLGFDVSIYTEVADYKMIFQKRFVKDANGAYVEKDQYAVRKVSGRPCYVNEQKKTIYMEQETLLGYYIDDRAPVKPTEKDTSVVKVNQQAASRTRSMPEDLVVAHAFLEEKLGAGVVSKIPRNLWKSTVEQLKKAK